jgi:FkbM family methyltransferase
VTAVAEKVYTIRANGVAYRIRAHPESRVADRLRHGIPYEHMLLSHIAQRGYKGVAVDVGAHIGNHALHFACACGLEVHAFEPIFGAQLLDNLQLNPGARVTPYTMALGAKPGWALPVGFGSQRAPVGWGEIELRPGAGPATPGAVPVETLDAFHFTQLAVIKIDVEGMETDVLRGGAATLERCRPDIYVEARDADARRAIRDVLHPLGYLYQSTAKTSTPVDWWTPKR